MVAAVDRQKEISKDRQKALILWFEEVNMADVSLVGGKNASLGEMIQQLTPQGINVPGGFATTAYAYRYFIQQAGLEAQLHQIFRDLDVGNLDNLRSRGKRARALILDTPFPPELAKAIIAAYRQLCERHERSLEFSSPEFNNSKFSENQYSQNLDVAVRSSATAEDLPDASFAGQQETYLNVHGVQSVLESCHKCFASLFTDRAISYRTLKGFDHFEVSLSVGVQKMIRSDLATSGVMFSIDTETGFKDAALITAAYGLGENVVQGAVNPDEYMVFKPTLTQGFNPILSKRLGSKEIKMVYDIGGSKLTKNVPTSTTERNQFAINDTEILQLAKWACQLENHYSQVNNRYTPMDIEWAKDGISGELFIVQARPETVQSQKDTNLLHTYRLAKSELDKSKKEVLVKGRSVGEKIGSGIARIILEVSDIAKFQPGEVLITNKTDPDWEPIMKQAKAIVTNQGGRTCHAAIIAREMGIPAIVGCHDATQKIQTGQKVTVSCAEGEQGKVYAGLIPFEIASTQLEDLPDTKTKILINVSNPEEGKKVIDQMASNGLVRGENGLQIYMMCELPSNVLLADQFSQIFDGFSIGSNDLTQLTLGLDRDSALVAHLFDERSQAVQSILKMAIANAKQNNRKIGICGQAPSDYPEFAKFLVEQGINSLSLNPDSVLKTKLLVAQVEREIAEQN